MRQEKTITEAEFERRTAPTMRLFFSVDLENSTRLKQSADRVSETWLSAVLLFVRQFPQLFEAQLQERARTKGETLAEVPPVWKVLGDELIFVAAVRKRFEVLALVESFREALRSWNHVVRHGSERGNLLVKGAVWLAGFPVMNAAFETEDGREDYAGPSVDAGFRLSKLATPRRLALSVDLAWLLYKCGLAQWVHFEGTVTMKGVAEEMGYPALWIEVGQSGYLKKEAQLLGYGSQADRDEMIALCASFIEEFGVPNYLPFLNEEPELTPKPPGFAEHLQKVKGFLREKVYLVDEDRKEATTPLTPKVENELLSRVKQQEKANDTVE